MKGRAAMIDAALSDIQTGTLLLPLPGQRWKPEDRALMNKVLLIAYKTLMAVRPMPKGLDSPIDVE